MFKRYKRKTIFRGPWLTHHVDKVRFPAGLIVNHHFLDFNRESVAAVVTDNKNRVLMVKSYRYIVNAANWELPAGNFDPDETVFEAARREVREESGYQTSRFRRLSRYYPIYGIANKLFNVVRCRAGKRVGVPDPNEVQSVRWFTPGQIKSMIRRGRLQDGYSLTALLLHFHLPRG